MRFRSVSPSCRSPTWFRVQNFGILLAFGVGFVSVLLILTELNQSLAGETSVMLFKRETNPGILAASKQDAGADEEKGVTTPASGIADRSSAVGTQQMKDATPEVHDVFSFQHLNYTVPVGKDTSAVR